MPGRLKIERFAVLIVLAASPFWLSALPFRPEGHTLRMVLTDRLQPALEGFQAARTGFHRLLFGLLNGPFLFEENRMLRDRLAASFAHEETHRELFEENARLRTLVQFKKSIPWAAIPAEVIGRDFTLWSKTLLLDKGSRDGVAGGMAVVTPAGLVGRIGEVGERSSRVVLLADSRFRVTATLSSSRISGLAAGTPSGDCLLTYLPVSAEVKEGEKLLTSGGRSFCPGGILIGSVGRPEADESRLFLAARIRPAVQAGAVEEVLILKHDGE